MVVGQSLNDWVLAEQRIYAMDSMGHNWWSVCVTEAGLASLSIIDEEPIEDSGVLDVKIYEDDKVTDVYWNLLADGRRMLSI